MEWFALFDKILQNISDSGMDQRLLLKEKDYELLAGKRLMIGKHSFNDPLLNPPKPKPKKGRQTQTNLQIKPVLANNILQRRVSKPVKNPTGFESRMQGEEENENRIESTPWRTILGYFNRVYDIRKDSIDVQVANPFGSQGLKAEANQRHSYSPTQSEIKEAKTTISIRTYIGILQGMKKDLRMKWENNDKVGSLQIAIQSCKLLHDTSNAKFHALKFAYVMDIIEEFGMSVFKRIKSLSFPQFKEERIDQITITDLEGSNIPESGQQICRNWLLKISSIRQLIPRTIVETTLLRLHFFLDNGVKAKKVLYRLSRSNRCFGEYINCIFFCTFLIRMGREVLPLDKDYILDILDDVFFYIKQGKSKFCRQDVSYDQFFVILEPFFISSFEALSQNLSRDKFKRFCSILPQNPHPIILTNFIDSFSPSLLIDYAVDLVKMFQRLQGDSKYLIYKKLFERLSGMVFSQSGEVIIIAWTDLSQLTNLELLLDMLGPLTNIIFKNLSRYEKNRFYALILQRFSELFDNIKNMKTSIFVSFSNFLTQILQKIEDVSDILTLQPFLHVITYFPVTSKTEVSSNIVQAFLNRDEDKITDPVVVHLIMGLMKSVPDANVTPLALRFLDKIDFGKDLEQTLSFYGEMRASFGYIQKLTVSLVYKAAGLTYRARQINKERITNKLIAFLQATISFCYITVPVLDSPQLKLKLYLYLSEVALSNNLISQATSLIKTCITEVTETDFDSDRQIYDIFFRIVSFLIVMPDDPENEYLFLFNGMLQAFQKARFKTNYEHILKLEFYTKCIVYLSCQAQERLPFHLEGVTSNDALFKSVDFRRALVEKIMSMADLLEEEIPKVAAISGGTEVDSYLITHLVQCAMTLISTFEGETKLVKMVKSIVKVIEKSKDRVFSRELKAMQHSIRTSLMGLSKKIEENELQIKLQI